MCLSVFSQNKIDLKARFDIENKTIKIKQTIQYQNTTNQTLDSIYLNDWSNSFSTKKTALATRLAEEYKTVFHLAKNEDRGFSVITSMTQNNVNLEFSPLKNQLDVIKVKLAEPLKPNATYTIDLEYMVQVPNSKFTSYGITDTGDLNLRYWYITPAVFDGNWQYYSNKDLDDMYIPKTDMVLDIEFPENYTLTSELDIKETQSSNGYTSVRLEGKDRVNTKLFLNQVSDFETIKGDDFAIVSDIDDGDLMVIEKVLITEKVSKFLLKNFGAYPHDKLLLTKIDYSKDPVYGLNFLPKIIEPYPKTLQYELKLLKIILHNYLENTLLINPREEQWLLDGIQIFYTINYVNEHYPNMKFLGSLADYWAVKPFHAASMTFNDKYMLAYMLMARTNRNQPLTMAKDSLLKFNKNIANKYKAGLGLKYLEDFVNDDTIETTINSFLRENKLKQTNTKAFEAVLKSKTEKNIDWFFKDYISSDRKIDFKIQEVSKTDDSVTVIIKNKSENAMPVSLYMLENDSIVSKDWIENIDGSKTVTLPRNGANKLALNYENTIPEYNLRDNWKSLKGFLFNNKPLQVRLFKDIEDPHYNQVFLMPITEFNNIYDGLTLGIKAYNKTILRKLFNYRLEPQYAFKSKTLTGGLSAYKTHYFKNKNLYALSYGVSGSYKSYAEDLFVTKLSPSISLNFRDHSDLRSNKQQLINIRYLDIKQDENPIPNTENNTPNYSVFNARFINSNNNLIKYSSWYTDLQIAKKFSKVAFNYEYRRLFESNRQLNIRFFTGAFLTNNTDRTSNYFSFALDKPSDYLFDYSYLGRSESTGLFSQQYIEAEGGFKSKLETAFANQWITTANASTTLWNYILLYGDVGLIKNKYDNAHFVYDSGLRINLVTDYFEIYLPLYSNLGWEIGQPNYDQKIRFKFTVDPQALLGLFRRRWF
ncbi:metalloprotease [Algibacter miyuki]|uniref:Metalloprotease n=1 Tax=Algibacter miyuki TaxID=1306933 RepID=A0ABV5H0C6_9FLAO|nr:metalloprotease [Algibacter miyuki]MDN3664188.1 metalloprotease [Algibacter miyuki]MDN3666852.1 metalloprotease [Algibacter miyuki]